MENRCVVTVSRKWDNPQITHTITGEDIKIEMPVENFKNALIKELESIKSDLVKQIGSVAWTFTQVSFEKQFNDAFDKVFALGVSKAFDEIIESIKEETAKVM